MKILLNKEEAAALSEELRRGSGSALRRRRGMVALSALSVASMTVIALYQTGVIPHLPEPPVPGLDADAVDSSAEAYAILSTPDAALGAVSYAATLALAAMDGAERPPWIPLLLLAKVGGDAAMAAKLTRDQWTKHKAFCSWCLLAAAATFASVPLAVPEARAAWRARRSPTA